VKRAAGLAALLLAATGASAEGKLHVVRPGESLSTIARDELGDVAHWELIYRANRDRIKDPARIYPGQTLSIPEPGSEGAEPPAPGPATGAGDDG